MKTQKQKRFWRLGLFLCLLLTAAPSPVTRASGPNQSTLVHSVYLPVVNADRSAHTVRDEVIVKLDVTQPGATIDAVNQTYAMTTVRPLAPTRAIYLLRVGRSGFAWGGYDPTPYNTQYPQQMLGLPAAHAISQGAGVVVAVIDTGVQLAHPDLAGRLTAARIDFIDGDDVPEDECSGGNDYGAGHGTHVAGIIHLVAPQAQIMPIRVLDTDGRGYSFVIAEAILFALENGADVINLSLGMEESSSYFLEDIIDEAAAQDVVVVAAAGNLNNTRKQFPAAADCALGVTAIDPNRVKASFATYGNWVSLAAPGVGIHSTLPVNGYGSWSGTSMAAPFVAGQAALLLGLDSDLTVVQVADLMGGTAAPLNPTNPGYINQLGAGQIDVIASLQALQAGVIPEIGVLDDDCSDDD